MHECILSKSVQHNYAMVFLSLFSLRSFGVFRRRAVCEKRDAESVSDARANFPYEDFVRR